MKLSLIMPVYNEEKVIEKNVMSVYLKLKEISASFELIICDDSSRDSTPQICADLARRFRELRYVRYDNGPSRRENLSLAIKSAKGDIIIYVDSDLSVGPFFINALISGIDKGYDIVIGSRYAEGAAFERSFSRNIISRFYNLFMRIYFGSKIRDHQCGFKAFKRHIIFTLIDELGYDSSLRRGWFWDVELLLRAQFHNFRIFEMPIEWKSGSKSNFEIKREIKMIPYVLFLKWRL